MKYTLALFILFGLLFSANASANCCNGMNAQETVDCIITKASQDADIEQAPSEGNSQMTYTRWKEKHPPKDSEQI